jgi:nitrite reductase/ring-hydroxylating ferredoxin subunit
MISRRGLLLSFSSGMAAIGLTALSETAANAAKTYTVCKTTDIAVRSGKTFSVGGKKILITQPKKGTFKAFVAVCTHAGSALNGATNNEIVCQSHGARFDASTGMAKAVAPRALQKVTVSVSGSSVKVKF